MKIPFFKSKVSAATSFNDLILLLGTSEIKKLRQGKQQGVDFLANDSYNHTNILQYYIKNHHSFNYDKWELLTFFVSCGIDINHKANKRADENSALHLSMYSKDLELATILLKLNAEIDITDTYGNTPLLKTILMYRGEPDLKEIIVFLIQNGASLERKNFHDVSAKELIATIGGGIDAGYNKAEWDLRMLINDSQN